MRILICNWKDLRHPAAGGAEVYTHECAKRWAKAGHQVTLLCAAVAGEAAVDSTLGYRILRQGSRLGVYRCVREFLRAHSDEFDVIIDEINTRPFFAHHATDTPVVALAHQVAREVWFHETPLPLALVGRYILEPLWLRRYEDVRTLTVSESSADSLRTYGLRNLSVVLEGVELPDSVVLPIPKASVPTLAFCGRLVATKRPDHAIAAFARAAERLDGSVELHVIGTGPLEAKLRKAAPKGVVIHGSVGQKEKFEILGSADALLCTSSREGWGLVVSEAAAVGTPTIGYDVAGLRDSIRAAEGVIVAPRIDALADAIVEWLPHFRANPRAALPYGGAASWDCAVSALSRPAVARPRVSADPRMADADQVSLAELVRGNAEAKPPQTVDLRNNAQLVEAGTSSGAQS
jgi:glycosyltransferase involved in cell wall biosynthesis